MFFDIDTLSPGDRYKLLVSVVVPRPIAFVTTQSAAGRVNAAPFSYFNLMGHAPPIVAIGAGDRAPGEPKDTPRNIRETGEFVVNLVDEALAEKMVLCATDFPPDMSEVDAADLAVVPSTKIAPPRIEASPIHLECVEVITQSIGQTRVILGRVVALHIRDDLIADLERRHVDTPAARLIGRMHGGGWYARTSELFEQPRKSYKEWLEEP